VASADRKRKEIGITPWNSTNAEATNKSGFTAFPGGAQDVDINTLYRGVSRMTTMWFYFRIGRFLFDS
jgi:hypothetical protein